MAKLDQNLSSLRETIRVELNGDWKLDQISDFTNSICYFYDFFLLLSNNDTKLNYFIDWGIYDLFNSIYFGNISSLGDSIESKRSEFYREIFPSLILTKLMKLHLIFIRMLQMK